MSVTIAMLCGVLAVLYGIVTSGQVLRAPAGNARMQDIVAAIQAGAKAYLGRQYTTTAIAVGIVAANLFPSLGPGSLAGAVRRQGA